MYCDHYGCHAPFSDHMTRLTTLPTSSDSTPRCRWHSSNKVVDFPETKRVEQICKSVTRSSNSTWAWKLQLSSHVCIWHPAQPPVYQAYKSYCCHSEEFHVFVASSSLRASNNHADTIFLECCSNFMPQNDAQHSCTVLHQYLKMVADDDRAVWWHYVKMLYIII